MTSLILNVDRDNDFGEKIQVAGPITGYTDCYNAALKLMELDPEDSDANALFGALKVYSERKEQGEDVDIAVVMGDKEVGAKSDEIIAKQLDEVLLTGTFDDVILVTDGAEDDYVMPLILSRVKIRYVKHIIVRHNQNIESIYYYIVRALKDKKIVNKFEIPFGIVFLTYGLVSLAFMIYSLLAFGISSIGGPGAIALTFVAFVLGVYFIGQAFDVVGRGTSLIRSLKQYAEETRITFVSYTIAFSLVFVGIASSYVIAASSSPPPGMSTTPLLDALLLGISYFIWWCYGAIFAHEAGIAVDNLVNGRRAISRNVYVLLFSLSVGLILFGMLNYIRYVLKFVLFPSAIVNISLLILGIIIAVVSSVAHRYYAENQKLGPFSNMQKNLFHGKQE